MAPVVAALRARPKMESLACATAQHREMLDQVLEVFGMRPDFDLNVMQPGQTPSQVAARVFERLDPILRQTQPDWLLVQGDTATVGAAALCGFYGGVRVGHVEAGLRTYDRRNPFPEEVNRRLVGVTADLHFAPTPRARRNLIAEGVTEDQVLVTGNAIADALQTILPRVEEGLIREWVDPAAGDLGLVATHRRESFGTLLENICLALKDLAGELNGRVQILYLAHPNPLAQSAARRGLEGIREVRLAPPAGYLTMLALMRAARLILTDSGGIQEEAPSLGVPVLVLREKTERPEAVEAGVACLVGTDRERIRAEALRLLTDSEAHAAMAHGVNPYGDGRAASRIVAAMLGEPVAGFCPEVCACPNRGAGP